MTFDITLTIWDIINAFIYVLPAYVANASPVIFGGGKPLDFGKNFIDGRRIFGDHKTIRGLISGIVIGTLIGLILPVLSTLDAHIYNYGYPDGLILAFLLSVGTHMGDLLGSFIKRRINLKPGAPFPIADQVLFLILAIAIAWPFYPYLSIIQIAFVIVVTLVIHPLSNLIAYLLKLKEHPW